MLIKEAIDCAIINRLSFGDALIVVASESAHCETLWIEDLNHGQVKGKSPKLPLSFAKGMQGPESDVDLLVELTEPRFDFLVGIQVHLEKKIGKPVD